MSLRLDDYWIWDFWFAQDGSDTHVFFLHAPRALGDPELRHRAARIGHAVSKDLVEWSPLAPPFDAGPPGSFDDLATWTGSVLQHDSLWHMFYTGISSREEGAVQRVLHATSPDLLGWEKTADVVETDSRWYESVAPGEGDVAWRDPWVFRDEESDSFHMLTTARAKSGPVDGRGVIGHAVSADLSRWSVQEPLSKPGDFLFLEVPQLFQIGGVWRVLFSAPPCTQSAARRAHGDTGVNGGTHYLVGQEKLGPYALVDDPFFVGDASASLFAGRMLEHQGRLLFFAFHGYDEKGRFHGELTDPMPVTIAPDGSLALEA
ncbi:MAG TPA: hypothetical protein VII05_03195 [Gaiellaceae bacterium]|jgi:beta-fructofuranosidase